MAERRATNKYYPPGWDPSKGSINTFVGQHPLRDRAKKIKEGILVVRFEMPFNIWCGGCNAHIGKGVRYNAEKKQAGSYHSTKIWNFRMKCHLCDNYIEVQTDPEHSDFVVLKGGSKKVETWDAEDAGTAKILDEEEAKKLIDDPFYKIEQSNVDKKKAEELTPFLDTLIDFQQTKKDDYLLSSLVRRKFRTEKKEIEGLEKETEMKHVPVLLLKKSSEDKEEASKIHFKQANRTLKLLDNRLKKRLDIKSQSIFAKNDLKVNSQIEKARKAKIEAIAHKRLQIK